MPWAARVDDHHVCHVCGDKPHEGGPIDGPCSSNVRINGKAAARATDRLTCTGADVKNTIVTGSGSVHINGLLAARVTDKTMHVNSPPGNVAKGSYNVCVGGQYKGCIVGNVADATDTCRKAIPNGQQRTQNCGPVAVLQLALALGNKIDEEGINEAAKQFGAKFTPPPTPTAGKHLKLGEGGAMDFPGPLKNLLASQGITSTEVVATNAASLLEGPTGVGLLQPYLEQGRGVIATVDMNAIMGLKPNGVGHQILVTGLEYDANGNVEYVIVNDTQNQSMNKIDTGSKNQAGGKPAEADKEKLKDGCGKRIPVDDFKKAYDSPRLKFNQKILVTDGKAYNA